ncbi:zf-ZPR1-domain-containing protein [Sistotremastrum niveocremeum HHB9708]|uniref:Zf-ZPR1-domain-containing protein n=2 Tax=Sistotremastraceae TaxID=3402574 RepID=A0A164VNB6_9AGAM|nr:zf-ZPR1-domain-containing protein [Sistotremastrum niveocremeum HHB9708]KZT39386.1 putative ZPR1-protein binds to translation elongation factor eEF-1 [Sistotremastrum suecicum HHB10207 ss-3]
MAQNFFPSIGSLAEQTDLLPDEEEEVQVANVDATKDDEDRPLQEVESLCMSCGEQGVTRMMLTSIPYFREVIVMSFRCEHCGAQNNEVQSAGGIRDQGSAYTAKILNREDLDRQIVKSASCTVSIPEWELTIPPNRGQLTNVEGLLRDIVNDLSVNQPLRRIEDEPAYKKVQKIIDDFTEVIDDSTEDETEGTPAEKEPKREKQKEDKIAHPFTVILDDPAGSSWIEFIGSMADPKWNLRLYHRTKEQTQALGFATEETEAHDAPEAAPVNQDEVLVFHGTCSSCGRPLDTRMKTVSIPYFKDIIIMSTNCDACGYKDNEVKSSGAISEKGKRITLKVEDKEDLSRDILKSETCGLTIPEIDLVLQPGTLGGRFTTIEGILEQIYEELSEKVYMTGDSHTGENSFEKFLADLKDVKNVTRPYTLIIDDPMANSYLQNIYAPDPDPNMTTEIYERTWAQNEELGLNDMKVENYAEPEPAQNLESVSAVPSPSHIGDIPSPV